MEVIVARGTISVSNADHYTDYCHYIHPLSLHQIVSLNDHDYSVKLVVRAQSFRRKTVTESVNKRLPLWLDICPMINSAILFSAYFQFN